MTVRLTTVACGTVFSAQRWRTTAAAGPRLRVDARTAIRRLTFAVPAGLLPRRGAERRTVGFMRVYTAGRPAPRRTDLVLAPRGAAPAAAGGATVRFRRGAAVVSHLPAGATIAELTFYRVTAVDGPTARAAHRLGATVARGRRATDAHAAGGVTS